MLKRGCLFFVRRVRRVGDARMYALVSAERNTSCPLIKEEKGEKENLDEMTEQSDARANKQKPGDQGGLSLSMGSDSDAAPVHFRSGEVQVRPPGGSGWGEPEVNHQKPKVRSQNPEPRDAGDGRRSAKRGTATGAGVSMAGHWGGSLSAGAGRWARPAGGFLACHWLAQKGLAAAGDMDGLHRFPLCAPQDRPEAQNPTKTRTRHWLPSGIARWCAPCFFLSVPGSNDGGQY